MLNINKNKPKVLVAMSGGVDSSVAAALLLKQGYLVAGAYMKNFSSESWQGVVDSGCPWEKDLEDVRAVCEKLKIPFRSFNFEKEYKEKVIAYFFAEYAAGHTPNPDVMCNKEIKFKLFLEKALELGFDYIATGHYARVRTTSLLTSPHHLGRGTSFPRSRGGIIEGEVAYELLKGVDLKKDQSYFLYALNQKQLSHTLFPVGEYTKTQVRQLARNFGLPNAEKKDSQGICFVGRVNLRQFLKQRIPEKVGKIVDSAGKIIGRHPGAWYYTIGQRHGLGIGGGQPYYVAQKDVIANKLTVAKGRYDRLVYHTSIKVNKIHWINESPALPFACQAKIRYQQPDQECTIRHCEEQNDEAIQNVEFQTPQFAIAPGQAIVFFNNEKVIGGAIIS